MGKLSILLRGERIRKCITQKTVADFVGVTEATVSRWETGDIENMRLNRLVKLAEVLRISPMEIIKLYESRGEVMDLDKYDSDELRQVGDFFTVTEHGGTLFRIMSRPTFMDMMKKIVHDVTFARGWDPEACMSELAGYFHSLAQGHKTEDIVKVTLKAAKRVGGEHG